MLICTGRPARGLPEAPPGASGWEGFSARTAGAAQLSPHQGDWAPPSVEQASQAEDCAKPWHLA